LRVKRECGSPEKQRHIQAKVEVLDSTEIMPQNPIGLVLAVFMQNRAKAIAPQILVQGKE
jgi:hypothetical protein